MQRRDRITLQKVISEMNIGIELLGDTDEESFLTNEMQKILDSNSESENH